MKFLPVAIAALIVAVGTYFEGNWMERWQKNRSEKLDRFTQAIEVVRKDLKTFVDSDDRVWTSVEREIDAETRKLSGCTDAASLQYFNKNGDSVNVFVAAGHSRHITIHTPEWCYPGDGFDSEGDPGSVTLSCKGMKSNPEFLAKVFKKDDGSSVTTVKIFWTYTEDGHWRGPRMPKPAYGNRPALFKIYLITTIGNDPRRDEERLNDFAIDFMPQITSALFKSVDEPATATAPASETSDAAS